MILSTYLSFFSLLAPFVQAAALSSRDISKNGQVNRQFRISSITIEVVKQSATLQFSVEDLLPGNLKTSCSKPMASFSGTAKPYKYTWPQGPYIPCQNSKFGFNITAAQGAPGYLVTVIHTVQINKEPVYLHYGFIVVADINTWADSTATSSNPSGNGVDSYVTLRESTTQQSEGKVVVAYMDPAPAGWIGDSITVGAEDLPKPQGAIPGNNATATAIPGGRGK